jgi:hypothetical protein
MLVTMENRAKAVAHFCFCSVSIINKFRGVVEAAVANENTAYNNETKYPVFTNRNETRIAAVAK